jgi:hypothetical protein
MPRQMLREDYRNELLLWILFGPYGNFPGYVDQVKIHSTVSRYKRELKKRGIDLVIYDNLTGFYPAVDDAGISAIGAHILGPQRSGSTRVPVTGNIDPFLRKQDHLTPAEIISAKESAEIVHKAYFDHKLDSDLKDDGDKSEDSESTIATL